MSGRVHLSWRDERQAGVSQRHFPGVHGQRRGERLRGVRCRCGCMSRSPVACAPVPPLRYHFPHLHPSRWCLYPHRDAISLLATRACNSAPIPARFSLADACLCTGMALHLESHGASTGACAQRVRMPLHAGGGFRSAHATLLTRRRSFAAVCVQASTRRATERRTAWRAGPGSTQQRHCRRPRAWTARPASIRARRVSTPNATDARPASTRARRASTPNAMTAMPANFRLRQVL